MAILILVHERCGFWVGGLVMSICCFSCLYLGLVGCVGACLYLAGLGLGLLSLCCVDVIFFDILSLVGFFVYFLLQLKIFSL